MLFSLAASHKTADFAALERMARAGDVSPTELVGAHPGVRGAVLLATCNRLEAYLDLEGAADASFVDPIASAIEVLASAADMKAAELRAYLRFTTGLAAVQHLFSVTSGLDSVVVGEDEVSGQVRRAFEDSRRSGAAGPELETIFQRAFEASREVRTTTGLGVAGRSVVRAAIDLAAHDVPDWAAARVLLVGTGRYAAACLAALRERGVTDIRVYSVSDWGAQFADAHDVPLVHRSDYPREAAQASVIVACTRARHHVLDAETIEAGRVGVHHAATHSGGLPFSQVVIDLGLPRNVHPGVARVSGVTLLDLETVRVHAPYDDALSLHDAHAVVDNATHRYSSSERVRDLAPALAALRRHVFGLVDDEVERLRQRGGHSAAAEESLRHLASALLHQPMARSRALADEGEEEAWIGGLAAVFGIDIVDSGDDLAESQRDAI